MQKTEVLFTASHTTRKIIELPYTIRHCNDLRLDCDLFYRKYDYYITINNKMIKRAEISISGQAKHTHTHTHGS